MTTSRDQRNHPSGTPRRPPGPVRGTFWILLVSAGLRALVAILTIVEWNAITQSGLHPLPKGTTVAQATHAIHVYLATNLALDLLFAVLYVVFAVLIKAGRNWARITATVVIVIFALFALLNGTAAGTDIITLFSVLIELAGVALLYLPQSKAFFAPRADPT